MQPAAQLDDAIAPAAIRTRSLVKRYGDVRALDGLSVDIPVAALCGLVGKNGAGKTTLLSILATLDEDYEGDVQVLGAELAHDIDHVRQMIGFVPDHLALYDALSVQETMAFFAAASGVPKHLRKRAIEDVVELCGLADIFTRSSAGLSKGQTQRICVARALLHQPKVLLLDEPASGLDPRARIELKELLKKLAQRGTTVIVSSHILTELGDFCDHVVIMDAGKVVRAGPLAELSAQAHGGQRHLHRLLIELDRPARDAESLLRGISCVREVFVDGTLASCVVDGPRAVHATIARTLMQADFGILQMAVEKQNLEALFLSVTADDKHAAPTANDPAQIKTPISPAAHLPTSTNSTKATHD